jgi:cell division protease FtsH
MFWVIIVICLVFLWSVFQKSAGGSKDVEIPYSDLFDKVQTNQVADAAIQGNELRGHLKSSLKDQFHTTIPANYEDLEKALLASKVNFSIKEQSSNLPLQLLINIGPFVLLGAIWFFMLRQMQSGGNKALSFGKSRARLLSMQQKKVTFKDVAGVDEAKEELKEIIEYLREPQNSQGRPARRTPWNRQNPPRPGRSRRSECALFLHLRFRLR